MGLRDRVQRWWKILKFCAYCGAALFVLSWWYFNHLADWADEHFALGFNWDLPSRVYSDVEFLYPGLNISERNLRDKLDRLGYRDRGGAVKAPGDYAFLSGNLEIYLRNFDYPQGPFTGFPLRVKLENNIVRSLHNIDSREQIATVRLEPELIASIFSNTMEDRTLVRITDVPDACLASIILIEDERYFQHFGIDPRGIARAAWADLKAMSFVQGGSTLTQQLVKNYFLSSERSITRKLKEALIAIAIERRHSKKDILEAYVNEIYLGQRGSSSVSGYGEAARLYFAKDVNQLTAGECALLAGMIRAPSRYSPFRRPDNARERRNFVLKRIYDAGVISEKEYTSGRSEAIITPKQKDRIVNAPYFIDFVKQQLSELYTEEQLKSEGLRIFTTLDMTSQLIAERVVSEDLDWLESTYGKTLPKDRAGELQGALISLQPQTGFIRSMVGGRNYRASKFNRITQAKRQPGSVFKPFVFLTAFDDDRSAQSIAPSTLIHDVSFTVESGGEDWTPRNYDKEQHGPVSARETLAKSYNIATARLAIDTGLDAIVETARDAGIESPLLAVPSIALGSFEVTPLEMAAAYTIFPNNGIRAEPLSIIQVTTKDGEILERDHIALKRRFAAAPVYLTTNVMKDAFSDGTAIAARRYGFTGIAAGKTGTTSDYRDSWFAGFTPELLTITWVGYDDNATTNMSGARGALPLWSHYMQRTANTQEDFPVPQDIILVKVDPISGHVWTRGCPEAHFAPFIEGQEANAPCPLHGGETAPQKRKRRWKWQWN